jgi:tripartite ATP-independent transporter DctM subunit
MLLVVFCSFTAFMMGGIPIALALGAAVIVTLVYSGFGDTLYILPQQITDGIESPSLIAVPFFVLAGSLMNAVGITDRIFSFANALVGHFRAGLAQVVVVAAMVFSGVSGAAVADIAAIGSVAARAMRERGYDPGFSAAIVLAASVLGPIIPPSIAFVIYSFLSNTSIARLFLGGLIPGALIAIALMVFNRVLAIKYDFPRSPRASLREFLRLSVYGITGLIAPGIIMVAIITGTATATEAGVVACGYALLLGLIYRTMTWEKLWEALTEASIVTAIITLIIGFSAALSWLMAIELAPQKLGAVILSVTETKWIFIALLVFFLLLLGCIIEGVPAILVLTPMLLPITDSFGIDRVHFGMILTMALVFGIAHPPMGIGLYLMAKIGDVPVERLTIAMLPFFIPLLAVLFLVAYVPALTLWLPNLIMGAN